MRRGQQQPLPTPKKNRKLWISGALNWVTGRLHCVVGPQKDSALFLSLLNELRRVYRCHRRLHLAVDNDGSHTSGLVQECAQASRGRLCLHRLPAWSPETNPVELIWWGLHEAVTRNHRCADLDELLGYARRYLAAKQPFQLELGKDYGELERAPPEPVSVHLS
jgi:putative transposase